MSRGRTTSTTSGRAEVLANGGHVVNDERPWVIADPEGNEACLLLGPPSSLGNDPDTQDFRDMGCGLTCYPTASFRESVDLAATVAGHADEAAKALMVDVRPGCVTFDSGKDQQETEDFVNDEGFVELARRIQAAARGMGLSADPSARVRFLQIAIHAVDIPVVRPFWMAVLGYQQGPYLRLAPGHLRSAPAQPGVLVPADGLHGRRKRGGRSATGSTSTCSFPTTRQRRGSTPRWSAGGRITNDSQAPAWWTLADPEGNEVDVVVASGRV